MSAQKPGLISQRLSATQRVESVIEKMSNPPDDVKITQYEWILLHTLHINGPNTDIYAYLAEIAVKREQWSKARYFVRRSLKLDKENEIALKVNEYLRTSER